MTTLPAYERDPRLRELDVEVLAAGVEDGRAWGHLSDTVLYPEGGGQPANAPAGHQHGKSVCRIDHCVSCC